ncbi:MAG TPA: M23 family metallopeptidase [Candidatus Avamphibacillus intestinigallinarum]|nr:M23 family metallopeptidase [Candidatus Avamphibacillus intestinigallinarum]
MHLKSYVIATILIINTIVICILPNTANAQTSSDKQHAERMALYEKIETITQVPWYYIAAIDQYERNIQEKTPTEQLIAIDIPHETWFGIGNIFNNQHVDAIQLFNGIGKTGNADQQADPKNPEDILYTMAQLLLEQGHSEDDFKIALWSYYQRDLTVQTIMNIAHMYQKFNTIDLSERAFPVEQTHNYSYKNTWGDSRGFGGRRIHEGTDIFANYGVPVRSTTYGVVELKGWNMYGGWRIGIRDHQNVYHYYAHLNGYTKGIKVGDIVKPGDVLGSVGSTGYGPPGTSGKFPPHLHYGMYRDNGQQEWSFDPFPYLKKWEA